MSTDAPFRALLLAVVCTVVGLSAATAADLTQAAARSFRADYQRIRSASIVQDRNVYVLTLLQHEPAIRRELAADPALAQIATRRTGNSGGGASAVTAMILADEEIAVARLALAEHIETSRAVRRLVREHLGPSGAYQRLSARTDAEMLAGAWSEAARGINQIISQFALGRDLRSGDVPAIDSASHDVDSPGYQHMIAGERDAVVRSGRAKSSLLFFEPSLDFALRLLAINRRDEAARHLPLELGENRAALERIRHMTAKEWGSYPYASLLVHGDGPTRPGIAISSAGRERVASAAALFSERKAPLIIVSGGYVHPKQTIFAEAIEMKRELMSAHNVPASAILIEPHARHTTTNIRNAARILFGAGVPADKPSLSVSSQIHIDGILADAFRQRCDSELGYQPAAYGARVSDVAAEFIPNIESLHIDPRDPLDP